MSISLQKTMMLVCSLVLLVGVGASSVFAQTGAPPRPKPDLIYPGTSGSPNKTEPDIFVSIWATPNVWVTRGGTLTYEIRVKNVGDDVAEEVPVYLPYNPSYITVVGASSETGLVRLSQSAQDYVILTFVQVEVGQTYVAHLQTQVSETLPDETILAMRASYESRGQKAQAGWRGTYSSPVPVQGDRTDTRKLTNYLPILVGSVNESSPLVWMEGKPLSGEPGMVRFTSDRFVPGELVSFWVNTPYGAPEALEITLLADEDGRFVLDFSTDNYRPGTYQLVAQGMHSELTGAASFDVE